MPDSIPGNLKRQHQASPPMRVIWLAPGVLAVTPAAMDTMTRKRVMRKPMRSFPRLASMLKELNEASVRRVSGT